MSITPWGSITELAGNVIDKIFPDPIKAQEAKARLIEAEQAGELQDMQNRWANALQQLEVNKVEAGSDSLLVAGWRPFIGWTCGGAFAWNFVLQPALLFLLATFGVALPDLPVLDLSQMMPVLLGMLGLGAYRSYEKTKGVSKLPTRT